MIIRPYEINDEVGIEFTDVASREWGDDDDEYAIECLYNCNSYTIIDDKGYKNVCCFIPCEDGSEYVYFVKDRRSNPLVMKYYAKILDERAKNAVIWSLSQPNQEKMHKFFNMVKNGNMGDKELWVRL
nr:MAG TPA: hypothetical protein [Caudoviricetes sp.]